MIYCITQFTILYQKGCWMKERRNVRRWRWKKKKEEINPHFHYSKEKKDYHRMSFNISTHRQEALFRFGSISITNFFFQSFVTFITPTSASSASQGFFFGLVSPISFWIELDLSRYFFLKPDYFADYRFLTKNMTRKQRQAG